MCVHDSKPSDKNPCGILGESTDNLRSKSSISPVQRISRVELPTLHPHCDETMRFVDRGLKLVGGSSCSEDAGMGFKET